MTRTETRDIEIASRLGRTVRWYDTVAPYYACRFDAVELKAEEKRFLSLLPQGQLPVLDLGCGAGRDCALLTQAGLRTVGVDLSFGLLHEARKRTTSPLVQGDVRRLPFGDGAFRGVWSVAVLLHLDPDEVRTTLREVRRLLVPGGVLFLSVRHGHGDEWRHEVEGDRWFKLYRLWEMAELVNSVGFEIDYQAVEPSVTHDAGDWVNIFASRS